MENRQELYTQLWNSADALRGKMDASEYKNYLLGLIFYKHLSDQCIDKALELLDEESESSEEALNIYQEAFEDDEMADELISELQADLKYVIRPELTYTAMMDQIYNGEFQLETLQKAFNEVEQSDVIFDNLFSDIDLYSSKLGKTPAQQNKVIAEVMKNLAELDLSQATGDVLGDAYEYLIGQFASDSGKKAGEFYTPHAVSELMARIVLQGKEEQHGLTAYDPTMGSGSLLLTLAKYSHKGNSIRYYGQELNATTYNLARMNMMLHGVDPMNQHFREGDTLDADWPSEEPTNFDAVVMNPPYSQKWSAEKGFLDDPRYAAYGVLAPKSKADYAFLLHGLYHLKAEGTMTIVLPHGVLFRGAAEGKIRKRLLELGMIDAVIGLPANIFFNTSIPTCILILKKNRTTQDVLFIDASQEFEKEKTQNYLTEDNINKIIDTYQKREDVDKYAHVASFDEIKENDFNLNIPRYVDTFEEEEPVDLEKVANDLKDVDNTIADIEQELEQYFNELQQG